MSHSSRRNENAALGYALCAVLLWSTVATAFKLGLSELTPSQLLFSACVVSTLVFALATLLAPRRSAADSSPRQLLSAAMLGLVNPLLYYLLLFEAYDRLPAQIAQPLNYTWAIALALLSVPLLGQRLSGRALFGISISYLGVVVLLTRGSWDTALSWDGIGLATALASTLVWAWYWLRSSLWPDGSATRLMLCGFTLATPLIGLYCAVTDGLPPLNGHTLTYGLWVGLVEMGLTFLLWQRALQLTGNAARIGQLIFVSPFLSLIFINQFLGETIHISAVIGLAIIVAGIIMARSEGPPPPIEPG